MTRPDYNHRLRSDAYAITSRELREVEMVVRKACGVVTATPDVDSLQLCAAQKVGAVIDKFFAEMVSVSFHQILVPLEAWNEYVRQILSLKNKTLVFRQAAMAISQDRNDDAVNSKLWDSTVSVVRQMDWV